jgi:hypothetical protein
MQKMPLPPQLTKNTQFENTFACVSGQIPITMNTRYEAIGRIKILLQRTQVADETVDPPAYSASTPAWGRHISNTIYHYQLQCKRTATYTEQMKQYKCH